MTHTHTRPSGHRNNAPLARVLIVLSLLSAAPPASAQQGYDNVMRQAADYHALVEAENGKSALCRSYENKPATLTSIDTLASRLTGAGEKGEYETTAQYEARRAAAAPRSPTVPVAVAVPIDRSAIRYDADAGGFSILADAFPAAEFSDATQASMAAEIVVINAKEALSSDPRTKVGLSTTERTTSAGTARNAFGAAIRVSEVDRTTRVLSLRGDRLIGFAKDGASTVAMISATASRALAVKAGMRAALVVQPEAPFARTATLRGAAATNRSPVHYTERSLIVFARPLCALILDPQGKVLAAVNAGGKNWMASRVGLLVASRRRRGGRRQRASWTRRRGACNHSRAMIDCSRRPKAAASPGGASLCG